MFHQPLHDFGVCLLHAAQIPAEAVLIQLFSGGSIPQAAGIGADLVGQDDAAVRGPAELQLEVCQRHAAFGPKAL